MAKAQSEEEVGEAALKEVEVRVVTGSEDCLSCGSPDAVGERVLDLGWQTGTQFSISLEFPLWGRRPRRCLRVWHRASVQRASRVFARPSATAAR